MNQPTAILRLCDVGKTYHMGDVAVPVLHNVELEIQEGQITGHIILYFMIWEAHTANLTVVVEI